MSGSTRFTFCNRMAPLFLLSLCWITSIIRAALKAWHSKRRLHIPSGYSSISSLLMTSDLNSRQRQMLKSQRQLPLHYFQASPSL